MTPPPLEDHLSRLADDLTAPATADARQAIGRRAATLRRRRQVRNAVGGGLIALLIVAGAMALLPDDPADVEIDHAAPGSGSLPALTVNLDGWHIARADDTTATPGAGNVYDLASGSLQVFRQPDDLAGPSIFLRHELASDVIAEDPAAQPVTIRGTPGQLLQTGPESFTVSWSPAQSDSHAYIEARGLKRDQVLQFADGLRAKDPDIRYPGDAGTELGFDAGKLPTDMQEITLTPTEPDRTAVRRLVLQRAAATIDVAIDDQGEASFETHLGRLLATGGDAEQMSVLGHPAVLVENPDDGGWSIVWRQTDAATVVAALSDVGRSTVDDFVNGLEEISDDEWRVLAERHAGTGTTQFTVAVP